jgi:hypothetical protein
MERNETGTGLKIWPSLDTDALNLSEKRINGLFLNVTIIQRIPQRTGKTP